MNTTLLVEVEYCITDANMCASLTLQQNILFVSIIFHGYRYTVAKGLEYCTRLPSSLLRPSLKIEIGSLRIDTIVVTFLC